MQYILNENEWEKLFNLATLSETLKAENESLRKALVSATEFKCTKELSRYHNELLECRKTIAFLRLAKASLEHAVATKSCQLIECKRDLEGTSRALKETRVMAESRLNAIQVLNQKCQHLESLLYKNN